ncbi:discoidin domain-containing protein [uncultured Bacteroides sp.]|uniref:galactose-binding domain-containing protein n=1 Tax=uncultured Bacteroides sp. TaxID=162156 RepID=UPI002AA96149|nr:discoidin domain-containing protein [uncultured Bacteroides sp.]
MKNRLKFFLTGLAAVSFIAVAHAQIVYLHSNNPNVHWKVKALAEVASNVSQLSQNDYNISSWVDAVVPGTVFNSYVVAGLEKDPNFGDNIYKVDRSKYDRSFWYRTTFKVPASYDKKLIWLNFNGVNRRADIYLNGHLLGSLDGFMQRGRFNVTDLIKRDVANVLTLLVSIPQKPLANQGSPAYLSSGGWDWMPYVPGLNSGITDKVYLSNTGAVTLIDPWIRTDLPSLARADVSVQLQVKNNADSAHKIVVKGIITPGNLSFSKEINVDAETIMPVLFDDHSFPQLSIDGPKLWWPNGYGKPNLYNCRLEISVDGQLSDVCDVKFGIKKYTYDTNGNTLHLHINGVRLFVKGANWGISEYMLRCRGAEYDTKVRLHHEMNFNMIRNWLGSTTDDEFYEACDRYGLMVWDDFWINSNSNLPYDLNVFNNNMIEKIKRVRNHPCIAVWCGDNESNPQPPLQGWMAEDIRTFDGNDRYFQPNSHADNLTGSGPWGAFEPRYYFTKYPDGLEGDPARGWGFRSEIGTAVVPNVESFKKFMPKKDWWPRNDMWNFHFFGSSAFNAAPDRYDASISKEFGKPQNIEDYCRKAQLINYESNKAMYEGWLDRMWEDASGVMTWMGQSAYPSMVWQTYDYYYDPTGAYWGTKSGCEPIHILWNPVTNAVKVANTSAESLKDLTAEVTVYNLDGKPVTEYSKSDVINSPSNSTMKCFTIDFNKERKNLSLNKPVYASSSAYGEPGLVADGKEDTRWSSVSLDNEWIYVDLGSVQSIGAVRLSWEASYGKAYKLQVSNDAKTWKEIYKTNEGVGGVEEITFPEVDARYVRLFGLERGWWFGYSLWSFDVMGGTESSKGLSDVHFIRLRLKDKAGSILSENNYWRGNNRLDFTALDSLPKANLKVSSKIVKNNGQDEIKADILLPRSAKSVAFAVHVQAVRTTDGERLLPAIMNDNYFTLMSGESRKISIVFDEALLQGGSYKLIVEPYNNK